MQNKLPNLEERGEDKIHKIGGMKSLIEFPLLGIGSGSSFRHQFCSFCPKSHPIAPYAYLLGVLTQGGVLCEKRRDSPLISQIYTDFFLSLSEIMPNT